MAYRQLTAGLFALALALAVLASGGFAAMDLDRGADIRVVDTDQAVIGIEACYLPDESARGGSGNASNSTNSATPVSVEITNRLGQPVTVERITGDERTVSNRVFKPEITPQDARRFTVPFGVAPSEITVVASANGVTTRITAAVGGHSGCPVPNRGGSPDGQEENTDGSAGGSGGGASDGVRDTGRDTPGNQ